MAWRVTVAASQRGLPASAARPGEDRRRSSPGEPAGEGVLLAGVVAAEQRQPPPQRDLDAVPEPRPRPRHGDPAASRARSAPVPAERAERDDDPQRRAAAPARGRATARRCRARRRSACSPAARSGRPRPSGCRPGAARRRRGPTVACAASPTRCRQANSQSPLRSPVKIRPVRLPPLAAGASPTTSTRGVGVAPAGDRPAPVGLVGERGPLVAGDVLAPRHQPGAGAADRHPGGQLVQVVGRRRGGDLGRRRARPGSPRSAGSSGHPSPAAPAKRTAPP